DGSQAGDAGACSAVGFAVSGMQSLLTAVRSAGAANLVLLGGVVGGNALSQWTVYKPQDPANNVAAAWHAFADSPCSATSCFDSKVAPVAQLFPVVAAEIGESDCQGSFIASVTSWLDTQGQGYLAFAWDAWPGNCQALIADYAGTPTVPYGQAYKNHLEGNPADAGGD
ncbi:MAG TPA: cellulase family glycosylhydrolase, partial [Polyangiaceae bacterium]|nr:cellulase family glycosylhydrolase [Polyangiaceae bacterium]